MHYALLITPPVATEILQIWDRPFKVLWGDFPDALTAQIQDPAVLRIAEQWPIGGADESGTCSGTPVTGDCCCACSSRPPSFRTFRVVGAG